MRRLPPNLLLAMILILIAMGMLSLSESGILQPTNELILRPLSALQNWVSIRYSAIRDMIRTPADLATLRARNTELELEIAQLQQEIIALREQIVEVDILAALLDYARSQPENRYIAADVIGKDTSPFLRYIWIGRGSNSGIQRGMPVVTERGLVGRVVEVFATSARVQLITDPSVAVNVRFQGTRIREGILAPQLSGELWVDLISQEVEVSPGDLVLTSGLGGNFPANIPVGKVISVRKRDYELFQQAVIQPSVDIDNLAIVLVIISFRPLPMEGLP